MVATRLISAEEFACLTDEDIRELIDGEVTRMSPAGKLHLFVISRINWAFHEYSRLDGNFHALTGEGGFVIRRDPDSVLSPDISIMSTTQIESMMTGTGTFSNVMPMIVIEVKSPRDRESQIARKLSIYLDSGIEEVWWIRPERKEATIHRPDGAPILITTENSISTPLLPGFVLELTTIF